MKLLLTTLMVAAFVFTARAGSETGNDSAEDDNGGWCAPPFNTTASNPYVEWAKNVTGIEVQVEIGEVWAHIRPSSDREACDAGTYTPPLMTMQVVDANGDMQCPFACDCADGLNLAEWHDMGYSMNLFMAGKPETNLTGTDLEILGISTDDDNSLELSPQDIADIVERAIDFGVSEYEQSQSPTYEFDAEEFLEAFIETVDAEEDVENIFDFVTSAEDYGSLRVDFKWGWSGYTAGGTPDEATFNVNDHSICFSIDVFSSPSSILTPAVTFIVASIFAVFTFWSDAEF